ncbi:hypothetical protein HII31_06459, partial [Pseudocercospora fuligena]
MSSSPALNMTAAQRAFNTNEILEAILYQIDDRRELLRLALLSPTAKDVIYGASEVGQKLSLSESHLSTPVWEVDPRNSTIVNREADHTLTNEERAAGLEILKPIVLNDFLLFDRHYANLGLVKRLNVDTRVAGWNVHLGLLQHALQARPECTILRMFLSKPPVEEVELAWMRPHPNGGYGSSGTTQLSAAGGVRLRDVVRQITVMQSNGLRVGDLTIASHLFVSSQQWNKVDAMLSKPVPRGLALQDLVGDWGTTRTQQPHRLNAQLFARHHGLLDITDFDGAICRPTTIYLPSNVFLYGTQVTQPPVTTVFVDFWPKIPSLRPLGQALTYFGLSQELQGTAPAETLVFLPRVCLPTEQERHAVTKSLPMEAVED